MYACACARTHTQTAHEVLDLSSGVGTRHLEGPKNLDGVNLVKHIFVYMYKVNMCIHVLGGGMKSGQAAFFFFNIFFLSKNAKQKM